MVHGRLLATRRGDRFLVSTCHSSIIFTCFAVLIGWDGFAEIYKGNENPHKVFAVKSCMRAEEAR